MTLEDLISELESRPPNVLVRCGFCNPHSYRGFYDRLAFELCGKRKIADMLKDALSAVDMTYEGYKGGSFTMGPHTKIHFASYGSCDGRDDYEGVGLGELRALLGDVVDPEVDESQSASEPPLRDLTLSERKALESWFVLHANTNYSGEHYLVPPAEVAQWAFALAEKRGYKPDPEPRCGHGQFKSGGDSCQRRVGHSGLHSTAFRWQNGKALVWTDDGSAPFDDIIAGDAS